MRTRSVAVLVTSACLLAVAVVYVTRDMLRLDGRKYRCMVLKQDVRLIVTCRIKTVMFCRTPIVV
ncbi:MAG: hypothetical protein WCN95_12490, partial [bacterium]